MRQRKLLLLRRIIMSEYRYAYVFTKKTNLLPWAKSQSDTLLEPGYEYYAKERDVQLILLVRYETERIAGRAFSHTICKIKCPVNPLPIKGEFEAAGVSNVCKLLRDLGWEPKEEYALRLFE
jgi:hypothetical protein